MLATARKQLSTRPDNIALLSIAAAAAYAKKDFTEAADLLKRALRLQPESQVLRKNLAKVMKHI